MAMFRPNKYPFLSKLMTLSYYIDQIGSPFVFLWLRISISQVFFALGKKNIIDMTSTVLFFENHYIIPHFISPAFLAYSFTFIEIICPILILIGLTTRFATLPLLGIVFVNVVSFMDPSHNSAIQIMILLVLLVKGPDKFSFDHLLIRHFQHR